ncbi:putative E3 ubiquitin-protein ligase ARI15 [Arabidopsis thaliana]|uniref:RBR-type E3 ubiquitin transferase n=3 Tax=Arabidopsis TaxID=3701 RepID=A0A178UL50_ARATH|nr:IBR domain [Arabidopsis thaliana x Arabidopsis arenosa]OAO94365.1 ATARI15 [Arabidopsis thaliana]
MEKLMTESGLKPVVIDSNQDLSRVYCGICSNIGDDDYDGDVVVVDGDLISTPFCSHKFCKACWSKYLEKNFFSVEKNHTAIPCPDRDCRAAVGPETIEKLTVRDQAMYELYVLKSYREKYLGWKLKQCPARGCNYVIEFHLASEDEEHSLNIVCLCGHIFCWRCMLESHRPVTCNNASDWLSRDLEQLIEEVDKPSTVSWIDANTKPCPHCFIPVEIDGERPWAQFLTCVCSGRFCWKCFRSPETHGTSGSCLAPARSSNVGFNHWNRAKPGISCLDLWNASQVNLVNAKYELEAFEESIIKKPSDLKEQDVKVLREGLMLIVQCRQFLKWSCAYDYIHTEYDMAKREYLRFLQENASGIVHSFSQSIKEETEAKELTCGKLLSETTNIGNFFYHFIKTLREGLPEVQAESYDNYGGPYWLCDRCTYGNSWFQRACKMCCDPTASKMDELSD